MRFGQLKLIGLLIISAGVLRAYAALPEMEKNDVVLMYGNSMIDRLQEVGVLEAWLQLAYPGMQLRVRSLAYAGDELSCRLRPVGYKNHLRRLLTSWPSKTLIVGFGMNESFEGASGLARFKKDLEAFVNQMAVRHPGARIIFVSPIAMEDQNNPYLPDPAVRNTEIKLYAEAMSAFCEAYDSLFYVDLFGPSQKLYSNSEGFLTFDGIHLNDEGCRQIGEVLGRRLAGERGAAISAERVVEVARAVSDKAHEVEVISNTINGVHIYGIRKRDREYDGEIPIYEKAIALGDSRIWELAAKNNVDYEAARGRVKGDMGFEPIPDPKPAESRIKPMLSPQQQFSSFEMAEGFAVNLFASEETFPDLQNPLQIRFDARGRLWVNVIPSYPAFVPGTRPDDKLLILEDTDGDGKADRQVVFARGLNMSCGFTFHKDGVVVIEGTRALLLKDTDGDGVADVTEELFRGFDHHDSHHGGMPTTDPFGHIFFSEGVFERTAVETPWGVVRSINNTRYRANLERREVSIEWAGGAPNPWKITIDDWGSVIQYNGGGQVMDVSATPWSGAGLPFSFRYEKGCGMTFINSPQFPDTMQGDIFTCHLLGRSYVSYTEMSFEGGRYAGSKKGEDLLHSKDGSFRPVDAEFGLDGALYISDFYNAVIGHLQHDTRAPYRDHTRGRIWRVTNMKKPLLTRPVIEGAEVGALLKLLEHPQYTVRALARLELARHPDEMVIKAVHAWMKNLDSDRSFLEGLWTLCRHHEPDPALIMQAFGSNNPRLRAAALQMVRLYPHLFVDVQSIFGKALDEDNLRVRVQAVRELSFLLPKHPELMGLLDAVDVHADKYLAAVVSGARRATGRDFVHSVPVLELPQKTLLKTWAGTTTNRQMKALSPGKFSDGLRNIHTYVHSGMNQKVNLTTSSGLAHVAVNDARLFVANGKTNYTFEIEIPLNKGANKISLGYINGAPPVIPDLFIQGADGELPEGVKLPGWNGELDALRSEYLENFSVVNKDRIRIGVIDGALKFNVDRFAVKAGQRYKLTFSNTCHMEHNLVIGEIGSGNELTRLATELAAHPRGRDRHYVPRSDLVLFSTPQLPAGEQMEKRFTVPEEKGEYPYLCTFPGHAFIMRGVMVVE